MTILGKKTFVAQRQANPQEGLARYLSAGVVVAVTWYGLTELYRVRLQVWEWLAALVTWLTIFLAIDCWRRECPRWISRSVAVAGIAGVFLLQSALIRHPLTILEIGYALIAMGVTSTIWRCWRIPVGVEPWWEILRRTLLLLVSLGAVYPFFTDRKVGEVDARWYAFMLADFIEQARAGVFPVFIGQGEHAYNGAVHVFRSAPLYLWLGGAWDFLTLRTLSVFALQHLTVITAAVAAGLGMYAALARFGKEHRSLAGVVAMLYVFSPGVLACLYMADMYMTYMAIGVLPLVICGNAMLLSGAEKTGWRTLAAGLALTWMAHPPIGLLASLATAVVQVIRLGLAEKPAAAIARALPGGLWLAGLAFYYFYSMSEVPAEAVESFRPDALFIAGMCLSVVGLCQSLLWRRMRWLLLAAIGAIILALVLKPWLWWSLVFGGILVLASWQARHGKSTFAPHRVSIIWLGGMFAAAVVWLVIGTRDPHYSLGAAEGLERYAVDWPRFFAPLSEPLSSMWDLQPGAGVWLLLVAALAVSFTGSTVSGPAFGAAALLLVCAIVRVPAVSDFLVGYSPPGIVRITNLPLAHRLMPVTAAFACAAGFFALSRTGRKLSSRAVLVMSVLSLVWAGWEARGFLQRGARVTMPRAYSERRSLPENSVMDRFVYDLLRVPDYYSNGKTDPWLDTRILNDDETVRIGPDELAKELEAKNKPEVLALTWKTETAPANWPEILPTFTVLPGEKLLLRFEFEPEKSYAGYLVFTSENDDYREYILPQSGMPAAFGTESTNSKVLSFWNTTSKPVLYKLSFIKGSDMDWAKSGDRFGTAYVSRYRPELLPIQVESFVPYRAKIHLSEAGIVETPRYLIPGYKATVDGRPAQLEISQQKLAMLHLPAGEHVIEVRYLGTWKLWAAAVISALTWVALIACLFRDRRSDSLSPT